MRKILLGVFLLCSSCFIPVVENSRPITHWEARQSCRNFCWPRTYVLEKRNATTYFCTCLNGFGQATDSVVVGNMGTIYR